jgi:hypothetical protein
MSGAEFWTIAKCEKVIGEFTSYTIEENRPFSINEYKRWRKKPGIIAPVPNTITTTLGDWSNIKQKMTNGELPPF